MTNAQRIIKFLAIAFALVLIVSIVSGILGLVGILAISRDKEEPVEKTFGPFRSDVVRLDIEIYAADLKIMTGWDYRVETDNPYITVKEESGRLVVREKDHAGNLESSEVILYIPEEAVLDSVKLELGAGALYCQKLNCENLNLNLGAGKGTFDWLAVDASCEIEVGAGELTVLDSRLEHLDLDVGVGSAEITARMLASGELDTGIGKIDLTVIQDRELYRLDCEDGIGNIRVDGVTISNRTEGTGARRLELSCGIGQIKISFEG